MRTHVIVEEECGWVGSQDGGVDDQQQDEPVPHRLEGAVVQHRPLVDARSLQLVLRQHICTQRQHLCRERKTERGWSDTEQLNTQNMGRDKRKKKGHLCACVWRAEKVWKESKEIKVRAHMYTHPEHIHSNRAKPQKMMRTALMTLSRPPSQAACVHYTRL